MVDTTNATAVVATGDAPKKWTLDEIGKLKSYRNLSGLQAQWALLYLKTGDGVQATQLAFGADEERAQKDSYRYLNNGKIEDFLDDIEGVSEHERLMRLLKRVARSKKTRMAQIEAIRLQVGLLQNRGSKRKGESR
jgi:hypothetical protein